MIAIAAGQDHTKSWSMEYSTAGYAWHIHTISILSASIFYGRSGFILRFVITNISQIFDESTMIIM